MFNKVYVYDQIWISDHIGGLYAGTLEIKSDNLVQIIPKWG